MLFLCGELGGELRRRSLIRGPCQPKSSLFVPNQTGPHEEYIRHAPSFLPTTIPSSQSTIIPPHSHQASYRRLYLRANTTTSTCHTSINLYHLVPYTLCVLRFIPIHCLCPSYKAVFLSYPSPPPFILVNLTVSLSTRRLRGKPGTLRL
jgi:hypothetical protein